MNLRERLTSLRLFPKLVLTFLLVLSPIYVIGTLMNESGAKNLKQEMDNSLTSRVNLYMEILDNDLYRVFQLLHQYVNDEDLQNLSVKAEIMSDFDRTQAVLRLKRRLDLLKQSSTFVENVSVMIPLMDRTISSNDNSIQELDRVQFEGLRKAPNRLESPFIVWNDRIFISMPYPETTNREPVFLLLVEISRSELGSTLSRFTTKGGGAVLTGKSMNWAISGTADTAAAGAFAKDIRGLDTLSSGQVRNLTVGKASYRVAKQESSLYGMSLSMFVPTQNVDAPVSTYRKWMIALSAASIAIMLAFSLSLYRIIHRPLRSLLQSFRRIEQGQFNQTVEYPFKDEFGYLYDQFNSMVRQLNVMVHEVYEQQYRARLSELRHLQSQINPHFLYNTYFILYRMAKREDNENLVRLTKHLGEYFQYITRDAADEVPFEREAHHARTYMEIQSIRFGHRIETHFDELPEGSDKLAVPRLILQPIIENAYNHSLEKMTRNGRLEVRIGLGPDVLLISVEDNGDQLTQEKLEELQLALRVHDDVRESTGMLNVHRRLRIKYGEESGLRLSIGELGGLKVAIVIPREGETPHEPTADH
ncbi:sensor histidine kinase [Cohnella candidum]|uniref:HAMP domain-containing protein n=1 Tax=Cohnella candidum TaxID=2674991 RepID=A0A3G3JUL5_9BACL|nr:histidine kinase [Cohnella candidum]AYQ71541.1 HAMP domain-containing protein [Cohnella candidum]